MPAITAKITMRPATLTDAFFDDPKSKPNHPDSSFFNLISDSMSISFSLRYVSLSGSSGLNLALVIRASGREFEPRKRMLRQIPAGMAGDDKHRELRGTHRRVNGNPKGCFGDDIQICSAASGTRSVCAFLG